MALQTSQLFLLAGLVLGIMRVSNCNNGGRYPSYDDDTNLVFMDETIKVNEGSSETLFEGDILHDQFVDDVINNNKRQDEGSSVGVGGGGGGGGELYRSCPTGKNTKRAAVKGEERLWKDGLIYYEFDDSISPKKKKVILSSMAHWEKYTCVRFQPRKEERDYLSFYDGSGCFTTVGRAGGRQGVSINDGCMFMGTVAHELAHAMGFWHEQSRPDRDNSVEIIWDNILPGKEHNFNKMDFTSIDSRGVMYDYNSIMHYGAYSFSIDDTKPTIRVKNSTNVTLGQRSKASLLDIDQANKMYCCPGGACSSSPCQRGLCSLTNSNTKGYTCQCFPGWYGTDCSKNDDRCALLPCGNGVCENNKNSYMGFECVCNPGYEGSLCDIDVNECDPNPCKNAAKCIDKLGHFVCECIDGYRGKQCEFLDCPEGSFGCVNQGVCVRYNNLCDFNNDCGDWSDEMGTCGDCSFEDGMCGWNNTGEWNWQINGGSTPSDKTGPDLDHTFGTVAGKYLFVEASDQYDGGTEAVVESPIYPSSATACKLQLSYHMFGADVRELRIEAVSNGQTDVLFKKEGPQGNKWILTIVDIGARANFSIKLVVVRGDGWKGDVAVDDITLPYCTTNEISDPCSVNPCRHGNCSPGPGGVRCDCFDGYAGAYCGHNVDDCADNNCKHGQCLDHIGYYSCQCYPGYEGTLCHRDTNDCDHGHCGVHGTCIDQVNGYTCKCQSGYTGVYCNQEIEFECSLQLGLCSPWAHSSLDFMWTLGKGDTPSMGTGPHYDHSTSNITGYYLYLEGSDPQSEGDRAGIELGPLGDSKDDCSLSFYYNMRGDTMGNISVILTFTNMSTLTLWHKAGDQGLEWLYAVVKIGRRSNFTLNIVGVIGSYWESDAAIDDIMIAGDCGFTEACVTEPCYHGNCTNIGTTYFCTCDVGYKGNRCDESVNICDSNPCGKYGTCQDLFNNFTCTCHKGYTGRYCQTELVCNMTCVHGVCSSYNNQEKCLCYSGYEGLNCDVNIDDCKDEPCNNGTCTDLISGYRCTCNTGYIGQNCTIENCDNSPCFNGGLCITSAIGYRCDCPLPFTGRHCKEDDRDNTPSPCTPNPCIHGLCTHNNTHHTCQCKENYTGDMCDKVDPCAKQRCVNGECQSTETDYNCVCNAGYYGPLCELEDPCFSSSPCRNGGTCSRREERFTCVCKNGYTGDICQYDTCNNTCDHGVCVRGTCRCEAGYHGVRCDKTEGICSSSPCVNGACIDYTDTFVCDCKNTPYTGTYCQSVKSEFRMCKFDSDMCGWIGTTDCTWTRHSGSTSTSKTGPYYDASLSTRGWYIYVEVSKRTEGTLCELSTTVPANACYVTLSYHMYGQHIGTLEVRALNPHSLKSTSLLKLVDEKDGQWHRTDLNVKLHQGHTLQLRGYVGSSYRGDIAVDSVVFKPCGYKQWPLPDQTTVKNVNCSFEDSFCGWTNTAIGGDWLRNEGKTISRNTGPPGTPHGQSYIYVESNALQTSAQLTSPFFFSGEENCLTVNLYMFGRAVGQLSIYQKSYKLLSVVTTTTDSISGSQGARWISQVIRLRDNMDSVIVLEVRKGSKRRYSWEGDIAVDEISVGKC